MTFWFCPVSGFSAQAFVGGLSLHVFDRSVDPSPIRTSLDSFRARGKYIRPVSVRRESGGSDHSNRRVALWMRRPDAAPADSPPLSNFVIAQRVE